MTNKQEPATAREQLIALLAGRSVRRGQFTLSSGRVSSLYIDARMTTMSPEGLPLIGQLGLTELALAKWSPNSIGGLTLGADPISYAISYASSATPTPLRAFTVRKTPKVHGTSKLIEGPFARGDHVVIIEDVMTTGKAALTAASAVRDEGGLVLGVLALIDREEGGREALEHHGLAVRALIPASTIVAHMTVGGTPSPD